MNIKNTVPFTWFSKSSSYLSTNSSYLSTYFQKVHLICCTHLQKMVLFIPCILKWYLTSRFSQVFWENTNYNKIWFKIKNSKSLDRNNWRVYILLKKSIQKSSLLVICRLTTSLLDSRWLTRICESCIRKSIEWVK